MRIKRQNWILVKVMLWAHSADWFVNSWGAKSTKVDTMSQVLKSTKVDIRGSSAVT